MTDRKLLARQLRDDASTILEKLKDEGVSIAGSLNQAADLLDGRLSKALICQGLRIRNRGAI
jgi:hypothetical protein